MGFAGMLKSPLFGLRATVDPKTLELLDKRADLYAKGDQRTATENAEMRALSDELTKLGFTREFRDPYFELFSKAMAKRDEFRSPTLTPDEMEAQSKAADEILDEIFAGEAK
jgi:hypothetical protein